MEETSVPAIDVRNVYQAYDKGIPVMQGTNLYVKKGNIYGLLGPSGCGKTTLLKLIIGRLTPDSGRVRVLGYKPGTVESKIPGSRIGYMPQELALYPEFTISETLHYFGRIHNMSANDIKDRQTFLLGFLDLPCASTSISSLGGGEQRRVSLAVALLHSPEILILDEPTVGVDPLLREKIWDHLVKITTTEQTSIIITTHYVEEARSANAVGMMRNGRILAEGPPDSLIQRFKQSTLEDVFMYLCSKDENRDASSEDNSPGRSGDYSTATTREASAGSEEAMADPTGNDDGDVRPLGADNEFHDSYRTSTQDDSDTVKSSRLKNCCAAFPKGRNLIALVIKNLNQMRRRIGFLLFQFLLPAVQITLYAFCVGGNPKNLPIHVVNQDVGFYPHYSLNLSFSETMLSQLDTDIIDIHHSHSIDYARKQVHDGVSWAALLFRANFSMDTALKTSEHAKNDSDIINGSMITIWMDETNQQILLTIQGELLLAYQNTGQALKEQAKRLHPKQKLPFDVSSAQLPIDYHKPIYGTDKETFFDFAAPGIMCSIIYFLAVGLTTLSLVLERKEGLFERSIVSGVTVAEMMLSHIGTQFLVMAIQTVVLLVFSFPIFNVYNVGSIAVIALIQLLIGFSGMCLGFVISTGATDESSALQVSLAVVFPFLLVSGILWPIEAMPKWLQYIATCLPLTLPVKGLRSVLGRGWGMSYYDVWSGYLVGFGWAFAFLFLSLIVSKIKRLD